MLLWAVQEAIVMVLVLAVVKAACKHALAAVKTMLAKVRQEVDL